MTRLSCDNNGIKTALKSIRNGGVVIFPTDTVYGIGCDPYNKGAVDRIFEVKGRDKTNSLPVLGLSLIHISAPTRRRGIGFSG